MTVRRVTDSVFLAAVFTATFSQLKWDALGGLGLFDLLAILFVAVLALESVVHRDRRVGRPAGAVLVFGLVLTTIYGAGALGLETEWSRDQFGKGLAKFVIHFAFLAAGVAYLHRRPHRYYWSALGWLCAGVALNAGYAFVQFLAAEAGFNLDEIVLSPLTRRTARTLAYGLEFGPSVDRARGLTTDPNHLGIMLLIPLLLLVPFSLQRGRSARWRLALGAVLAFLLVVEATTLSRSAFLGLGVGFLLLLAVYRRQLLSRALLASFAGVAVILAAAAVRHADLYGRVLSARMHSGDDVAPGHFGIYEFVPRALHAHPLLGVGLNNFAPTYYPITGKRDYGPLSFYVQSLVETGLLGTIVFSLFLGYAFLRLRVAYRSQEEVPPSGTHRALAWGLAAGLIGTMAANGFYLTMTFAYFYVFLILVLASQRGLAASGFAVELAERAGEELEHAPRRVLVQDVLPSSPPHFEQPGRVGEQVDDDIGELVGVEPGEHEASS